MARGPRPHTPERDDAVNAFSEILEKVDGVEPPAIPAAGLQKLCAHILADETRLMAVRALLQSIMIDGNPHKVTPDELLELVDCKGWPKEAIPTVSRDTITNFVSKAKKPQGERFVAFYLMALSSLYNNQHPAFRHAIPATLVRYCNGLSYFDLLIGVRGDEAEGAAADVIRYGRGLYQMLSGGNVSIDSASFVPVLASPLFAGIQPIEDPLDLKHDKNAHHVTAIRLARNGKAYVASKLSFFLLNAEIDGDKTETVLYLRTWMRPKEQQRQVRSQGYVVPRQPDVYLAQYHLDGAGLNISAIPLSELGDRNARFHRGLILAVDRDNNRGALASRIVFFRSEKPDDLIGTLSLDVLKKKITDADIVQGIVNYLHATDSDQVAIRKLDDAHLHSEGDLKNWAQVRDYLNTEEMKAILRDPIERSVEISGYLAKPLLVD